MLRPMWDDLAALAATQGGVFTRKQAEAAGYRWPAIRQLTRPRGEWVIVRRGVYMLRELWDSLDEYDARPLARAWAAHLSVDVPHVISHDSAAHAWELPVVLARPPLVHLTRYGVLGSRTEHGIKHHLTRRPVEVHDLAGLPVTSPAKTAMDLAREHGWVTGACAADRALRLGADADDFADVNEQMTSWPNIRQCRRAAEVADAGAETPLETLGRLMVLELGLGPVTTQFPVRTRDGLAFCDVLVGCHNFEFDGRGKYRDQVEGGLARQPAEEVFWAEKTRERDVVGNGIGVSRYFWPDCMPGRRRASMRQMLADYEATTARFGTTLRPEVAEFARQVWDRRARRLRVA